MRILFKIFIQHYFVQTLSFWQITGLVPSDIDLGNGIWLKGLIKAEILPKLRLNGDRCGEMVTG